jgi:hypothetical protein
MRSVGQLLPGCSALAGGLPHHNAKHRQPKTPAPEIVRNIVVDAEARRNWY